ncbi:MAG TPA: TIGR02221 family CRISPR-associated protein [Spirochaetota bacterium]|nr:TIGR02221 family CRISPR-associated protein [Spirochaetota bacterium]
MGSVYISFLGLGSMSTVDSRYKYSPASYSLNGAVSELTEFVQAAEIQLLGSSFFDRIIIIATEKSRDAHYASLKGQLAALGAVEPGLIIIDEDMTPEGQWKWFEEILFHIDTGDRLTVDLTHGYRSIPIVFSTAINFLRKAKNITVDGVYYGAFEKNRKCSPIIDMKDFYIINDWAEAVSRLVEDADARKLGDVAKQSSAFQAGDLNDPELIEAFHALTGAIRNVDINNVGAMASKALGLVAGKKMTTSRTGSLLLDLVVDKFTAIAVSGNEGGEYIREYYTMQMEFVRLLIDHRLYMQAFTVMREFIVSFADMHARTAVRNDTELAGSKQKKYLDYSRKWFADLFLGMIITKRKDWNFSRGHDKDGVRYLKYMVPLYDRLEEAGLVEILGEFVSSLTEYRNGFDHAWTASGGMPDDIDTKGRKFFVEMCRITEMLRSKGFLE